MYKLWIVPFLRTRYVLALAAGLLWAAAFPEFDVAGFAWVAPGLMVAAALGTTGGDRARLGYIAGAAHYFAMLYWLLLIPYRWHGIPFGPALGWLALCSFLALFPAFWVWFVTPMDRAKTNGGSKETLQTPSLGVAAASRNLSEGLGGVLPRNWFLRTLWALGGAAAWVTLEMLLARILGGFPWDLLGVSQYRMTPLIQVCSVTGVYGLSFLAVWVSLSLVSAGVMMIQRPSGRSVWVGEVALPVLTVAILFNLGFQQIRTSEPSGPSLKVTLIQPSIPQTLIWDASNDVARFQELVVLSEQALTNATDMLLWPEAAVPRMLRYDQETFEAVTGLARRHHVWMIIGSDDAEPRDPASHSKERDYFNSSFLISPEGELVERYVKRNLVMFGEYVPLRRWLPFLKYLTPIDEGGFTPGTHSVPFDLNSLHVKTQVLICFEDTFPHLARAEVQSDTDFLVNLTNDGWFDEAAAQWQQAATGLFRAVENHRPLIRCANNGLTCWVDARGIVRAIFRDERGSVYGKGFLQAEIPLPAEAGREMTFYTRHGDWFGWGCVAVTAVLLALRLAQKRFAA